MIHHITWKCFNINVTNMTLLFKIQLHKSKLILTDSQYIVTATSMLKLIVSYLTILQLDHEKDFQNDFQNYVERWIWTMRRGTYSDSDGAYWATLTSRIDVTDMFILTS